MAQIFRCRLDYIVLAFAVLTVAGCTNKRAGVSDSTYAAPTNSLAVCSGYGCIIKNKFVFTAKEDQRLSSILRSGTKSAAGERRAIKKAISVMERMARRHLKYRPDIEFSYQKNAGKRGQMDCVDESLNTTAYLNYLASRKMLKFHTPIKRYAERGLLIDGRYPHKSARMKDNRGVSWAVDSWKGPDGAPPEIMLLSRWYKDRNRRSNY